MTIDLQVLLAQGDAATRLSRLLGARFVPRESSNDTPIAWAMAQVIVKLNADDVLSADVEVIRLRFLAKHLEELEAHDPQLLATYRKKLTDPNLGNFFGTRHEVAMAASLIRRDVPFRRRSSGGPDFELRAHHRGLGIECVSAHLVSPETAPHVVDKLAAVVAAKSSKPYAQPMNVLAADVTNLQAAGMDHGHGTLVSAEYEDELASIAAESGFGSLLLFWLQIHVKNGRASAIESRFARADALAIDERLKTFLDTQFVAKGHVPPEDWRVPYRP